jgi:hypothetical protein
LQPLYSLNANPTALLETRSTIPALYA